VKRSLSSLCVIEERSDQQTIAFPYHILDIAIGSTCEEAGHDFKIREAYVQRCVSPLSRIHENQEEKMGDYSILSINIGSIGDEKLHNVNLS
jgi:hypothetical protein